MADQPERERFERLWRAHHQSVARFVARRLPAHEDGADLVAEVFLIAWKRLHELPPGTAASLPWLYGVAFKTIGNRLRGSQRQAALKAKLRSEHEAAPAEDQPAEWGPDTAALIAAFNELPIHDREAIALVTWEELTPQEASEAAGISAGRFRVRLHRAKRRLRQSVAVSQADDRRARHPELPQPQHEVTETP